ncbi:MAG: putative ABC transporter ATP-binding protein YadG [Chlamydiae bacterium]|nr:putative ABC transporter ATP-binding protein YadG [Chlamydiota bacterium]
MTLALEIKNFTKRYGSFKAVSQLSLEVKTGEIFGLLGPNGAGKSTTIGTICGINQFHDGEIKVFGFDIQKNPIEAKKKIGLSAQDYNVDPFLNLNNILEIVGGYYGLRKAVRKKRIKELLEQFNLTEHANKPFMRLSGGMKRRAMLARAMICDPELLILDEPTAALDVELRYELWEHIKRFNSEGKTIILTSHYIEEIERLCENIAIINHGKLLFKGSKKEIIKNYQSLEEAYRCFIKDNES